jgi:ribose transport system substrate-binding protein
MTHHRRLLAAVPLILGVSVGITACGGSDDATTSGSSDSFTVGISNPQAAQPILKLTQDSFTQAAQQEGIAVKALDAALDPAKQVTDVDQLVAQHVDAIVVYPLDANSLKPALDRAEKAGIKIIGWAALASPTSPAGVYSTSVDTGGSYRGSKLLGDYVKEQLGGSGRVLGVGLATPVPALETMVSQYKATVTEGTDIDWLGRVDNTTDDIAGAQKVVATALTKYQNNVQAIMAYNDSSAIGAAVAAKAAGLSDVVIVGQNGDEDGVKAVQDGRMSATVDLVPWRTGLILATLTRAVLDGKTVPTYVTSPSELYTKANLGDRLAWDDAESQIKAGTLSCADGGGCPDEIAELAK